MSYVIIQRKGKRRCVSSKFDDLEATIGHFLKLTGLPDESEVRAWIRDNGHTRGYTRPQCGTTYFIRER